MIERLERAQKEVRVDTGLNLSCAVSEGDKLYSIRYASGDEEVKSQFYSTDMSCVKDFGCY